MFMLEYFHLMEKMCILEYRFIVLKNETSTIFSLKKTLSSFINSFNVLTYLLNKQKK